MKKKKKYTPALGHDQFTNWYDQVIAWTMPEEEFRTKLIQQLSPNPSERILEFGFGTIENLIYIIRAEPNVNYSGLDIDPNVKVLAKEKLSKLKFLVKAELSLYEGGAFPYEDNSFDKVFSCLVFHQLQREEKVNALKEIYRVLKKDGMILICDWDKPSSFLTSLGFYAVQVLDGFATTADSRKGILIDLMKESGFSNAKHVDVINTNIGTLKYIIGAK
ncbi:MAG: class I SAM-dependent methyltransferase [Lewinella sp.]|uniref:class I SAM-dependent methyltransferase n=1 Tax=Lewinella sp. TaxID=2004506 RepID=UPI003D6C5DFD